MNKDNPTFSGGTTLRDYFAAKAMQGMRDNNGYSYKKVAEESYKIADEMLKQRNKNKSNRKIKRNL